MPDGVSLRRRLAIFVPHASDILTDHQAHGDGLVAFEIVSRLARRGHVVHVAAPRVDVRRNIPQTLRLYQIGIGDGTSLRGRLRYMLEVRRLFEKLRRRGRIDLVHQLNPVFTGMSLAVAGVDVPVVLGSYVGDWPAEFGERASGGWRSVFVRYAKRAVAAVQQRHAAAIFVTTPAARSRIVDRRREGRKVVVLPHGIDPALYTPAPPDDGRANLDPSILFLGGIEDRKGIFVLAEAFRRVRARLPRCRLVVAGWGHRGEDFVASVAGEREHVDIRYLVERADVPKLLRECTVFCMPSFGEPFGMALLEAMASGKPVVVTDAGGAAHIVDEQGGRKVPLGDAQRLADALIEILESPELQRAMGKHNREVVERFYDWDCVIERLEAEYRRLTRSDVGR
jgi:glycosyltransferase involved in cell wall biosynthesis